MARDAPGGRSGPSRAAAGGMRGAGPDQAECAGREQQAVVLGDSHHRGRLPVAGGFRGVRKRADRRAVNSPIMLAGLSPLQGGPGSFRSHKAWAGWSRACRPMGVWWPADAGGRSGLHRSGFRPSVRPYFAADVAIGPGGPWTRVLEPFPVRLEVGLFHLDRAGVIGQHLEEHLAERLPPAARPWWEAMRLTRSVRIDPQVVELLGPHAVPDVMMARGHQGHLESRVLAAGSTAGPGRRPPRPARRGRGW